jgi:hypothetical protein
MPPFLPSACEIRIGAPATNGESHDEVVRVPKPGLAPSSAWRLAILPVAHRFESWNFYRISRAGTWTAVQFFAGPWPGPSPVPRISSPLARREPILTE